MLLPSAVHVCSTFEFGAMFHDCLRVDPQGIPPFSPFSEPHECYCLALFKCTCIHDNFYNVLNANLYNSI